MSIFRKFLKDKAGNTIIPYVDKGGFPEDAVYHSDPTAIEDEIIDPASYSTSEKWTGGYWIDGKKVYKKTITGSVSLSANVAGYVATTTVVDTLINTYGSWNNWSSQYTLFGAYQAGQWSSAYKDGSSSKIVLAFLADNTGSKTYKVTVLYTK